MNTEQDQPETLAAILAEMRDERIIRLDGADVTRCLLRSLADRIEAAAEREREAYCDLCKEKDATIDRLLVERDKASAPGNAAALREALNRVEHLANDLRNITERDTEVRADANEIVDVCRAALTAPARNCDRFKTLDEAREAFQDLRGHKILADVELWDSMDEAGALVRWLFASAQGGAK